MVFDYVLKACNVSLCDVLLVAACFSTALHVFQVSDYRNLFIWAGVVSYYLSLRVMCQLLTSVSIFLVVMSLILLRIVRKIGDCISNR